MNEYLKDHDEGQRRAENFVKAVGFIGTLMVICCLFLLFVAGFSLWERSREAQAMDTMMKNLSTCGHSVVVYENHGYPFVYHHDKRVFLLSEGCK